MSWNNKEKIKTTCTVQQWRKPMLFHSTWNKILITWLPQLKPVIWCRPFTLLQGCHGGHLYSFCIMCGYVLTELPYVHRLHAIFCGLWVLQASVIIHS